MDADLADLCAKLLMLEPTARLDCHGVTLPTEASASAPVAPAVVVCYDDIRAHPFFACVGRAVDEVATLSLSGRVPSARWLSFAAVATTVKQQCDAASPRDDADALLASLQAAITSQQLTWLECAQLGQQLVNRGALHYRGVLSVFRDGCPAPARLRHVGANPFDSTDVLGLSRDLHGTWSEATTLAVVTLVAGCTYTSGSSELSALVAQITGINASAQLPRGVLVLLAGDPSSASFDRDSLQSALLAVNESIVVVPSCGVQRALGIAPIHWRSVGCVTATPAAGAKEPQLTQSSCFGFWCGGARVLYVPDSVTDKDAGVLWQLWCDW